jgi:hypothetical protein
VELAHYYAAILAKSTDYRASIRQLAIWAAVQKDTASAATRRLIAQHRIHLPNA